MCGDRSLPFARGRGLLLVLGIFTLGGCAVIGPQSITGGRGAYNEVINRTEDEQILNALVRIRYEETFGLMTVSSVTAGLKFRAQAGTEIGIGDSDDYAGNLVPFSAGAAYEENPTISYVPLSGQDFTRRMLSPVTLDELLLISGSARYPGQLLALAARNINGLRNRLLRGEAPSPEFARFIELYDRLRRAGVIDIVYAPAAGNAGEYFWDIHDYAQSSGDAVRELLELLSIESQPDGSTILLPMREAVGRSASAVNIQTRSAYEVLRLFGNGIDLPAAHIEAGIVQPLPPSAAGKMRFIAIRSADEDPDEATVRIRYRDRWFYIDATDAESKRAFVFLRTFIGMRLADPGAVQQAPVLTVPVN